MRRKNRHYTFARYQMILWRIYYALGVATLGGTIAYFTYKSGDVTIAIGIGALTIAGICLALVWPFYKRTTGRRYSATGNMRRHWPWPW
jgi:hypothetical protein